MEYREKHTRGLAVHDWMTQRKGYYVGTQGNTDIFYFGDPKAPGAEETFQKMCDDFDRGNTVFLCQDMSYELLESLKASRKQLLDWLDVD
jgi:hypothetical protein